MNISRGKDHFTNLVSFSRFGLGLRGMVGGSLGENSVSQNGQNYFPQHAHIKLRPLDCPHIGHPEHLSWQGSKLGT